ncbi:MAG: aquaporin [Armatimonadetes bacterium]|nr:aquaporin [Armatimonadota bacterium]MBS1712602.1 aquaporin [Armatimonadota bacterium]MBX3110154.1 aquaporin [Fimbriimonadaceae bacterium]
MNYKALAAEFIGVFALCFAGLLAIANAGAGATNLTGVALAHGLAISVMVAAFAAVSGAHFNPAVSLAMLATGRIKVPAFLGYIAAQLLGGLVASLVAASALGIQVVRDGTPALGEGVSMTNGILLEAVATFILVATVFGSAVDKRNSGQAPLYIGISIVVGILAIGPMTGAALNPARFLGPAFVGGFGATPIVWIVGPLLGGLAAGLLFENFLMEKEGE